MYQSCMVSLKSFLAGTCVVYHYVRENITHSLTFDVCRMLKQRDWLVMWCSHCRKPPSGFFEEKRKRRMHTDSIIIELVGEVLSILLANYLIFFTQTTLLDKDTTAAGNVLLGNLAVQLLIELLADFTSVILEERGGLPVSGVWHKRKLTYFRVLWIWGFAGLSFLIVPTIMALRMALDD